MTALPTWISADRAAQALLTAILAERPAATWRRRYDDCHALYPRYSGANARELRAIWNRLFEQEMDLETGRETRCNEPDDVIHAALREAAEGLTEVHGDPVPERMRSAA